MVLGTSLVSLSADLPLRFFILLSGVSAPEVPCKAIEAPFPLSQVSNTILPETATPKKNPAPSRAWKELSSSPSITPSPQPTQGDKLGRSVQGLSS